MNTSRESIGGAGGAASGSAGHLHSFLNNSLAIRQEIQRFESVHPSIYAIYDLIDLIQDNQIAQQIRDHVVCIEDSFVNSQEWTISRTVPELRLGIVGSLSSGKSTLVHRYLTGEFIQEDSPEGGRFKKEVFIDNHSHLLLIRDEGGPPEMQFTAWVDAVIFVFSLENEASFNAVYNYYQKMSHMRNSAEIPMILVGTQDSISDRQPRCIDDARARKLANDLKRCTYYETCATYGLNVERVFHDACQKILQHRQSSGSTPCLTPTNSRPSTPQGTRLGVASFHHYFNNNNNNNNNTNCVNNNNNSNCNTNNNNILVPRGSPIYGSIQQQHQQQQPNVILRDSLSSSSAAGHNNYTLPHRNHIHSQSSHQMPTTRVTSLPAPLSVVATASGNNHHHLNNSHGMDLWQTERVQPPAPQHHLTVSMYSPKKLTVSSSLSKVTNSSRESLTAACKESIMLPPVIPMSNPVAATPAKDVLNGNNNNKDKEKVVMAVPELLPTPALTPNTSRKNRRRSNLFIPSSKKAEEKANAAAAAGKGGAAGELGSGRAIPLKQGYLYKKSSKSLNKEWKKKYVTMCDDGRLTYHPSLHDYMDDVNGKEVPLQLVTVKVPGQKPRGSKSILTNSILTSGMNRVASGLSESIGGLSLGGGKSQDRLKVGMTEKAVLTGYYDTSSRGGGGEPPSAKSNSHTSGDEGIVLSNSYSQTYLNVGGEAAVVPQPAPRTIDAQTPNVKKRHRRMKSSNGLKSNDVDDSADGFEFCIVSLGNKQWHFEAGSSEERDEWVLAIEQEIFRSLQGNESTKAKSSTTDSELMQTVKAKVAGNGNCADCGAASPDWASLNLGILMCIECSGVHRNLGSHISKVRSVGLDEWAPGHLSVMQAVGNEMANSVWEAQVPVNRVKPTAGCSREEKEMWIRSKYEGREFVQRLIEDGGEGGGRSVAELLMAAVLGGDMRRIMQCLALAGPEDVNAIVGRKTALHVACGAGSLAIAQLLILNNANVHQLDQEGRTCLNYAKDAIGPHRPTEGMSALVDLLVGMGCLEMSPSDSVNTSNCSNSSSQNNTSMTTSASSAVV